MGSHHADVVDHRIAAAARERRAFGGNPECRQTEGRILGGRAFHASIHAAARDRQLLSGRHFEACHLHAFDQNGVLARAQREIVVHLDGRQIVAQLRSEILANTRDSLQQRRVWPALHQLHQAEADFHGQRIHLEQRFEVFLGRFVRLSVEVLTAASFFRRMRQAMTPSPPPSEERNGGQSGEQRQRHQHAAGQQQRLGFAEHLILELRSEPAVGAGAGDDQAAGDRDHQRRNHRHQAIADGEHGVGLERVPRSMLCCSTPIRNPAMIFTPVMMMLAMASRCVKREAPSMAP